MSLKVFHLVFIALSTLMSLFAGVWGFWVGSMEGDSRWATVGLIGFLGAVWLPYYGIRIYAKLFGNEDNHVR